MRKPPRQSDSCIELGCSSLHTASATSIGSSPTTAHTTARKTSPRSCTARATSGSTHTPHGTMARSSATTSILSEEFLCARTWTSEQQRAQALEVWNVHYNYHRPHTAAGNRPPASKLHAGVTNVMASCI
jgi:transposase InsO family protein